MSGHAIPVSAAAARSVAQTHAQDVPQGYKRSEVGVIPTDWDVKMLGDIGSFTKGKGIKRSDVTDDGLACIRYGEIYTQYNYSVHSPRSRIPESVALTSQLLNTGDLLFAASGETADEIGKCVAYLGDGEAYAGGDIVILSPVDQNSLYLGHLLNLSVVAEQKARYGQGDAVVHISARNLALVKLPLPPTKNEQDSIAEALSDVDGLIGALEALIAKKRAAKQAAMQQLLTGSTRLPGFSGEWETKRLGNLAHIKTGNRNNEDKVPDGLYPFFVRSEFVERIDTFSHDCEAILVPGEGRIGDILHYVQGRFDVHQRVYAITKFAPELSGRFAYFQMAARFGAWAMQNTVKAAVDSLRLPTFKNFEFEVPPTVDEQIAIATVLSDMDAQIAALSTRRDKARAIKQGMMQQLLFGRVRLVKPEAAA